MFKLWILIIVFSMVITYRKGELERQEIRILQTQLGARTLEKSDGRGACLGDALKTICILGSVLMCIWGLVSIYLGSQLDNDLSRIREYGNVLTSKVVACDVESTYSVLGTKKYGYIVDFEVNGEKKRSSTVASVYSDMGEMVDIYYMPHKDKDKGGIALVDVNENPGKERVLLGYISVCVAIGLFLCGRWLKSHNNVGKQWNIKVNDRKLRLIFAIFISVFAIGQLLLGGIQNKRDIQTQKTGEQTIATIRQCQSMHNIIYRGDKVLYSYIVEFYLDGKKIIGTGKSVKMWNKGDIVKVVYIMNGNEDFVKVVFAGIDNQVGSNHIYHGIIALTLSIIVWIDVRRRV